MTGLIDHVESMLRNLCSLSLGLAAADSKDWSRVSRVDRKLSDEHLRMRISHKIKRTWTVDTMMEALEKAEEIWFEFLPVVKTWPGWSEGKWFEPYESYFKMRCPKCGSTKVWEIDNLHTLWTCGDCCYTDIGELFDVRYWSTWDHIEEGDLCHCIRRNTWWKCSKCDGRICQDCEDYHDCSGL